MARRAAYRLFYSEARARAGRSAWILVCPAALSANGKRKQTAYENEKAARAALKQAQAAHEQLGTSVRLLPHTAERLTALHLAEVTVQPYGITLQNAAAFAATCCAEFGDLATALQLARWAALRAEAPTYPDVTVKQAMDERKAAATHLSDSTQKAIRSIFSRLYRDHTLFCENTYMRDLSPQKIKELLEPYKTTPTFYNNIKRQLSALCSWAADKDYMPQENPAQAIKTLACAEAKIYALAPEHLAKLLRFCENNPGLQLYFAVCAFAGIRPTECTRLRWADVSADEPIISVRSRSSKTGGARHITIRPVLQAWLNHCRPARVKPQAKLCACTEAARLAARKSVPNWQQDVLRHSFASYALKAGTTLADLQLDMGHRDLAMLRARYLNLEGLTKEKAAEWWSLTPDKVLNHHE